MSLSSLQVLADNREALLLAEVVALLHDLGKLSSQFVDQMSRQPSQHSQGFEHEKAFQKSDFVDNALLNALQAQRLRNQLRWPQIPPNEQIGQLLDLIVHHDSASHSAFLVRLLNRCDGADSGADKGTTRQAGLPQEAKQPPDQTFIANAFGHEQQKIDGTALDDERQNLSSDVGDRLSKVASRKASLSQVYACVRGKIETSFRSALGETRRAANDVTLWDHSFSVATLYKTALATFLLNGSLDIDHLRWRFLRVNFDVLGLYAKAVKISDLLGYQRVVDEACAAVKKLVEEEYPLGNEVYRDTTGIYFTFPDLDLPADLAQEIRRRVEEVEMELAPRIAVTPGDGSTATEQLKGILGKARREALKTLPQPFDSQNLSACWQQQWEAVGQDNWELCPICRLRPMREGKEACETCLGRRQSRVQEWLANPRTTIWIDEIADHNDRVALLVGRFGLDGWLSGDLVQTMLVRADPTTNTFTPKNPSPARLRRIWETCQRFWGETVVGKILDKHPFGGGNALRCMRMAVVPDNTSDWKEGVPYDGTINGKAVSLLWQESEGRFITISNLQLGISQARDETGLVAEWHRGTCTVSLPDKPGQMRTFKVQQVQSLSGGLETYAPYLSLLVSPDQFLALIPAAEALEIAEKIRAEYAEQFGKVQNRLPLFLGLVFFHRKTPLMAAMDTARRMLASELGDSEWRVIAPPQNDGKQVTLALEQNGQRIELEVRIVMGDQTTEDVWYPYFQLVGQPAGHHTLRFERNGEWWVHVKTLQAGDTVRVTPSRFAYLFLESTAQRFRFDPERDVLLLDELPRLRKMWGNICNSPEMTDTKLHAIHALFETKRQEWKLREPTPGQPITDSTFRQLVETTLKRDRVQGVTVEDVLCGRFQRCLDLHLRILKHRVKKEDKMNQKLYEPYRYFALALDPIHVGTGGYRLGRVEMTIVREPGTNLPKIPGTSLAGACRTYATMQNSAKWPGCAGQGQADTARGYQGHCGQPDCPICVTFGFSRGEGGSFQGLAQFSDARLVFFPVHSLAGPVWITCPDVLKDLGISESEPADDQVRVAGGVKQSERLNLGWLMLEVVGNNFAPDAQNFPGVPPEILNRAVLVSNKMFGHIVNDNLEVRTSVSIDPATGAAAEGALYTYEALPRGTVLAFEVVISDPQFYRINNQHPLQNNDGMAKVRETVESGLRLFEALGIGGMSTRGMGRLRVLNLQAGGGQ